MAAFLICYAEGINSAIIVQALQDFTGVPGRFEIVRINYSQETQQAERLNNDHPLVIVDYAHTPDGLENVLKAARALVSSKGKLITIFGCGGDRDTSKRPLMGKIASTLANQTVITSDNPRSEDPQKIIGDILAGIIGINSESSVTVEPDRAKAIKSTIQSAQSEDVIVIAGKGT